MTIYILFPAFAWQFFPLIPIDSLIVLYHFFVQEIEFVCTGWKRWGAWKGLVLLKKKSGISQLFMVICFPHLLALNLAFEKSRIILHLIDTSFSLAFFQFMFLSSFWKCWLQICLLSQSYELVFLMNESVKISSFENGFKIPFICFQNESVHRRVIIFPLFSVLICLLKLTITLA